MSIQVASLYVSVDGETAGADTALNRVDQRLNDVAGNATRTGAMMTAGLTLPLGLLGKTALTAGMDYQTMMAVFQESSGATVAQMRLVGAEAVRLGGDLKLPGVSSADSLAVMLELSKGGLSVESSMAAARGALSLAIVEQMGFVRAAQIQSGALNTFNLEGSQATRVADMLAAGSNASAASVLSLADGMNQAGFAFANANQTLPDLITALAILSNNGLSGSDAGTALKNAFMRLYSPTKEARGVMNELGMSFYDVNGNMIPLAGIINVLNTGMAGLTQEQRLAALETIFLSDGMKAMLPLMSAGSEGYLSMMDAVNKEGAAAGMAAAKNSGLRGAIEGLKSTVDTFLQTQAMPFLGVLEGWVAQGTNAVAWLGTLDQRFITAGIAIATVLAVTGPLLMAFGTITSALITIGPVLGLVIGLVASLAGVFAGDLFGVATGTMAVFQQMEGLFRAVYEAGYLLATGDFRGGIFGLTEDHPAITALLSLSTIARGLFANIGSSLASGDLSGAFSQLIGGGDTLGAALGGVWAQMQPALQAIGNQIWGEVAKWGMFLTRWITARIPFVLQELEQLGQVVFGWLLLKGTQLGFSMALWGLQLVGWAYRQTPIVLAELEGLSRSILAWALLKGTELGFAIALWGVGFVAWIAPMGVQFLTEMALFAINWFGWIVGQVPGLQAQFLLWADAFVKWVVPTTLKFLEEWPIFLHNFLSWIEGAAGPILIGLGNWATSFIAWIVPMIPTLLVALGAIALAIGAWILTTAGVLLVHLGWWASAFFQWAITAGIPNLLKGLGMMLIELVKWLAMLDNFLFGKMREVGYTFVRGMIDGIGAMWGGFVEWLNKKIAELPLAVKIALGLAAPAFVAPVVAAGATGTTEEPKNDGGNVPKAMLVMPSASGGGAALAMANSTKGGGSSTSAGNHIHYHNHNWTLNGKLDIRSVVREMIREVQMEND